MIIACPACSKAIRVVGDPEQIDHLLGSRSEFAPDNYHCFACGKPATGHMEPEVEAQVLARLDIHELIPEEALAALHGLGLPDERSCYKEELERIFGDHGIKLKGRQHHGLPRYYLDWLELQDGTRVFLAPSPRGVCIFRVTPPHRYSEHV